MKAYDPEMYCNGFVDCLIEWMCSNSNYSNSGQRVTPSKIPPFVQSEGNTVQGGNEVDEPNGTTRNKDGA